MSAHTFITLQEEFDRFRAIKNHPSEELDFAHWEDLSQTGLFAWVQALKDGGEKVIELIGEMRECRFYKPYENIGDGFISDVNEIRDNLRKRNIAFELPVLER